MHLDPAADAEEVGEVGSPAVVVEQREDLALDRAHLLPQVDAVAQELTTLIELGGWDVRLREALHPEQIGELEGVDRIGLLLRAGPPTDLEGMGHVHVDPQSLEVPVEPLGDGARLEGEHTALGQGLRPRGQRSQVRREAGGGEPLSVLVQHRSVTLAFMGINAYVHPITSSTVVVRAERVGRTRQTPLRGRTPRQRVDGGQTSDGVQAP